MPMPNSTARRPSKLKSRILQGGAAAGDGAQAGGSHSGSQHEVAGSSPVRTLARRPSSAGGDAGKGNGREKDQDDVSGAGRRKSQDRTAKPAEPVEGEEANSVSKNPGQTLGVVRDPVVRDEAVGLGQEKEEDGRIGWEAKDVASYIAAMEVVQSYNFDDNAHYERFDMGNTKLAFGIKGQPWVLLAVRVDQGESDRQVGRQNDTSTLINKSEVLKAERSKILELRQASVPTPKVGETFEVSKGGVKYLAFLEEKIAGFEIDKTGVTAFTDSAVDKFGVRMAESMIDKSDSPDEVESKRIQALASIDQIAKYIINGGETPNLIPDFQVRYQENTGLVLVLDPGDPNNPAGSVKKHLGWLDNWKKTLENKRYIDRLWKVKIKALQAKASST